MTHVVLDVSAILALLKGERGASKVGSVIADASVCAINQAEVISHFVHLGAPLDDVRAMLAALPYTVVAADDALAWDAGNLRAATSSAGLSLGDRFCLALAKRLGVAAYTADKAWRDIAGDVAVKIVTIR
ncbi:MULTISPECIES: type II toxin-antitoxin system VapC family toxin [Bacteria]|jgi:ribonuclease VapC|uniref:Twitching motility protein PilT n=5 Tax=Sphingomonas TaxID=13687 RepID=A0A0D1MDS2_9SPHN|nr:MULTISPECIES: type II toxin-antitoxin system VapC family toxin [Bacteria]KIU25941.1 twitching motility protein PilT [Sphingomonas melonis]MBB3877117.1 PIN domain nuclease of toxin-antitoxin system [Sphingomonas aquatilis]MBB4049182.1 PIN domain nuclease of toxin-antitoxin system [Sphingomonas zeae]MBB4610526.1 PIN domain nuclease of toxin-antitoxin system [Sphingomonas yabuuchiae]MBB4619716.1 PIN domain nuclease of toxin-antitoxin system [Sphingomonas abaci]